MYGVFYIGESLIILNRINSDGWKYGRCNEINSDVKVLNKGS